jgi:hypothetical protein
MTVVPHRSEAQPQLDTTTARQANLPQNIAKFNQHKNKNYPCEVADSNREDLIDWDECAIFLESANRSYGKVFVGKDLNEAGPHAAIARNAPAPWP